MSIDLPLRERELDDRPGAGLGRSAEERMQFGAPLSQPTAPAADKPLITPMPLQNPDGTPTPQGWRKIGERLRLPMDTKQRPGKGSQKYDYITARQVADRLDTVLGPGNWETRFVVIDADRTTGPVVQCTLSIFGQHKSDVGYPNNPGRPELEDEPYKAAYSDAFKRAAVAWGVGRWLYDDL